MIYTPKRATECSELINKFQYYNCDKNQYVLILQNIYKKKIVAGIKNHYDAALIYDSFIKTDKMVKVIKGVF